MVLLLIGAVAIGGAAKAVDLRRKRAKQALALEARLWDLLVRAGQRASVGDEVLGEHQPARTGL